MLLTPGPTAVPEFARVAMSGETIHHRTLEFQTIFRETQELLIKIMGLPEVIMLTSSGSGAMETCLTNLTNNKVLTINAGKFGERFGKIAQAHNIQYKELKYEWDTPVSTQEVINTIKDDNTIDSICIQICESAGGLRHPVEEIAKEVKKINQDIMVIADGITAIGVEKIDTTNIDALITGSQKAFMLPPGIAMIGLSQKAVEKAEKTQKGFYFNLFNEIKKQRTHVTAWTPATTIIIGLREILLNLINNGIEAHYEKTIKRASASRASLQSIGLNIYPKKPADSMSTVYIEQSNEIRTILETKYNVQIAGGQDHLKGKIFRINHMGLVEDYEAAWVLNAIEMALDELKIRKFDGTANKVFMENFLL